MNKLFVSILLFSVLAVSCRQVLGKRIRGSGKIIMETRQVSGFSSIKVSDAIDVYIVQDSASSVRVETDDNLAGHVETYEEGGVLNIEIEKGYNPRPTDAIKVHVSAPVFSKLTASGACDIYTKSRISSEETVAVRLTGSSDAELELKAPRVTADITGAGSLRLKGETRDLELKGTGSSEMECLEMMAENVSVKITGAGDAAVFASVKLDIHVTGAGSVKYKGNPSVNQKISGAGSVKKIN